MGGWKYKGNGIKVVRVGNNIIIRVNDCFTVLDVETGQNYDFLAYLKEKREEMEQTKKEILEENEKIKSSVEMLKEMYNSRR